MAENKKEFRRYQSFEDTHQELIKSAIKLIADKGVDALSIAALAREMGINRTTVYYHFDSREALIREVKAWSTKQLADAFIQDSPREDRIEHIYEFVLENPELQKMWIDDFLSEGDIRDRYPHWDELVDGISDLFKGTDREGVIDPEVVCINLLTIAFINPRIYKNSVRPEATNEEIVKRFKAENLRLLRSLTIE